MLGVVWSQSEYVGTLEVVQQVHCKVGTPHSNISHRFLISYIFAIFSLQCRCCYLAYIYGLLWAWTPPILGYMLLAVVGGICRFFSPRKSMVVHAKSTNSRISQVRCPEINHGIFMTLSTHFSRTACYNLCSLCLCSMKTLHVNKIWDGEHYINQKSMIPKNLHIMVY